MGMIFLRNRVSGAAPADAYAIGGASPELVAAFTTQSDGTTAGEYFRKAGSETTFGDLFTFSRSGTATYFDSNGTLQTAADGVARRNAYRYNSGWELAGMQMEAAAATNLHPTSNDFTTNWVNANSTETAGATTGPDDLTSGTKLVETTTGGYHGILNYVAAVGRVTCSIHVKDAGDSRYLIGRINSSGDFYVVFDPVTGTFTENGNGSANITNTSYGAIQCKNGWWRVYMSANVATSVNAPYWGMSNTPTPGGALRTYTGTTGAGLFIYGAQTEAGELSSYIPTSGSTATRAAETLTIAGADTPANTTAMSISMKGRMTYADNGAAAQETFLRWYADANNYITLDLDTDSTATGEVNANQSTAGTLDTVVAGAEYSPGVNVAFNIASRHTSGAVNVAKDGTAATADTTPTALADLSSAALTPGYDFSGFISELRVWGADIGDSGIAEATS